jgi:hypothetical protein
MKLSHLTMDRWDARCKRDTLTPVAVIGLAVFFTIGSLAAQCSELLDKHPDLESRMAALLRWANLWKRENDFKNYSAGKAVTVTAFYSATQVQVYLPEIDVDMDFSVGAKGQLIAEWNGLLRGSPVTETARMALRPPPEVRVKSVGPERTVIEDYWPSEKDILKHYQKENFSFRLPELVLPEYVQAKTVPKELESLKGAVREATITWLCPEGAPLPEAIIPFFDVNDPWIYVAVDGNKLQRGYFQFEWRDGKWVPDSKPWWPDPWRESEIISLAQRYVLATVKTDCPR